MNSVLLYFYPIVSFKISIVIIFIENVLTNYNTFINY